MCKCSDPAPRLWVSATDTPHPQVWLLYFLGEDGKYLLKKRTERRCLRTAFCRRSLCVTTPATPPVC